MSKGTITGGGEDGLYNVSIEMLDGSPFVGPAWCADLTEDLTGTVGVIDIAGDIDKGFNIQPGYDGNAAYDAARDGRMKQVQKFPKTTPTGEVFVNWALFPGWQKWVHPHRYGTVSAIDHDANTCTVNLDPCYATDTPDGKQLNINQQSSVTATFQYMSCNSAAFENGDRVIVEFSHDAQNKWTNPKVIGFESNPRSCGFTFTLTRDDGLVLDEMLHWDDEMGQWVGNLRFIRVYNSSNVLLSTTAEYKDSKWHVTLDNPADDDENGYWVQYQCAEDYVGGSGDGTQYPYRYKPADQRNTNDLIPFGDYTDAIPYFRITSIVRTYDGTPGTFSWPEETFNSGTYCPDWKWRAYTWARWYYFTCPLVHTIQYNWETSIDVDVVAGIKFEGGWDIDIDYCEVVSSPFNYTGTPFTNQSGSTVMSGSGSTLFTITYTLPGDRDQIVTDRSLYEFYYLSVGAKLT